MRCWIGLVVFAAIGVGAPPQPSLTSTVNQYCVGCHNEKLKTAGLALDPSHVADHPADWEKAVRKLRARYMPPVGLPRPDDRTYDSLVASVEQTLDQAAAAKPNPGRT